MDRRHFGCTSILILTLLFSTFLGEDVFAEDILGLNSIDVPGIITHRQLGLEYERLERLDHPSLGFIDQRSMTYRLFPQMKLQHQEYGGRGSRLHHMGIGIAKNYVALLDVAPLIEKCFFSKSSCIGVAPVTMNLYFTADHIRTYFSPALSLRYQIVDASDRLWELKFESKVFFDKNLKRTLKEEAAIVSIGASL